MSTYAGCSDRLSAWVVFLPRRAQAWRRPCWRKKQKNEAGERNRRKTQEKDTGEEQKQLDQDRQEAEHRGAQATGDGDSSDSGEQAQHGEQGYINSGVSEFTATFSPDEPIGMGFKRRALYGPQGMSTILKVSDTS